MNDQGSAFKREAMRLAKQVSAAANDMGSSFGPREFSRANVRHSAATTALSTHLDSAAVAGQEPLTWLRFRAAFHVSPHGQDAESVEWLEECKQGEVGDDDQPAFPVYAKPWAPAAPVAPVAEAPEAAHAHQIAAVRYWANAYADPAIGPNLGGHGVVANLLREYLALLESAATPAVPASAAQEPSDEQITHIAETLGRREPNVSDYDSWGGGYRKDENGRYSIPVVPRLAVPFARAVLAAFGEQALPGGAPSEGQAGEQTP